MVEGGKHCGQRPHGGYQYRCAHFLGKRKQTKDLWTLGLEELPHSRERAGAHVLWTSCESQMDVWELFSDNSYWSAILGRQ